MKKNINSEWGLSIGFYTGLLLGIRTYKQKSRTDHVLYLPFLIDICLTIYHN